MDKVAHYDLVVVGSGSGNSLVTPDFDDKRVAVVESGIFGGTCLNVGCIPTKMFVYAADTARRVRESSRYGVYAHLDAVDWPAIRDRVFTRIDPISEAGLDYRIHGPNTAAYLGRARFTGERRLTVTPSDGGPEEEITGDQVVVATGSHTVIPDLVTRAGVAYQTSDTVMRMDRLPSRLVILGGGYIGCEFAHVFSSLGVEVTQVVRGPLLLRHHDVEISQRFTTIAAGQWDVRLGRTVASLTSLDGSPGGPGASLVLDDDTALQAEELLVATGRAPSTDDLDLAAAGVAAHPDGRVAVDEYGRTSAPGVWSLGDVSSPYMLKHVANHEARVVAHNLSNPDALRAFDHRYVPAGVFTHPQIAAVGATEQELVAQGRPYLTKVQSYGDTAYGWAMEDTVGIAKVLADPATGLLLGAHLLGAHAASLIQVFVHAMSFGQSAHEVARGQYWVHPALMEVVENALLGLPLQSPAG